MDNYIKRTVELGEGSKEVLPEFSLVNEERIPRGRDDSQLKQLEEVFEDSEEDNDDDDQSESSENPTDAPLFHRLELKPDSVCRTSLLTTLLNKPDRAAAFTNMASRSAPVLYRSSISTLHGPSVGISPKEDPSVTILGLHIIPPNPIVMNKSHLQMALSPRTVRKNMLHSEMTESLRKSLLWERVEKRSTASAVSRRSCTAFVCESIFDEKCQVNCW